MRIAKVMPGLFIVAAAVCAAGASGTAVAGEMTALKPGAVKPRGWMRDRAEAMAKGFAAVMDERHEDFRVAWTREFRPELDKMSWEAGAWSFEGGGYWFDGLVRLAAQLDDPGLLALAKAKFDPVLSDVTPDSISLLSWLKRDNARAMAELTGTKNSFPLAKCGVLARGLMAYWEVTHDERVPKVLAHAFDDVRFLRAGHALHLPPAAYAAWQLTHDAKTARALDEFYADLKPIESPATRYAAKPIERQQNLTEQPNKDWRIQHGVVLNESMLAWIVGWQWTRRREFLDAVIAWQDYLDAHAMQPHGVTVAGEAYGHPGGDRGTETCTVVASLWLKLQLLAATGDGRWADDAERIIFNAAPQCASRDYRRHVYFQTPNRTSGIKPVYPHETPPTPYRYEEKHYPMCCTADLPRLIPAAIQYKWLKDAEGVVAALYGPDETSLELNGAKVHLVTETAYPFEERIVVKVGSDRAAEWTMKLRVPAWCRRGAAAKVNGEAVALESVKGFASVRRVWKDGDRLELSLPMETKVCKRTDWNTGRDCCWVEYGPLLMCAPLKEFDDNNPVWRQKSDWKLDPVKVMASCKVTHSAVKPGFDWPLDAPVKMEVESSAGPLKLVPYGSARFRVAMFDVAQTGLVDFGDQGEGGYPEIEVTGVKGPAKIRVVYANHPEGLGEKGDFWHETRANYMGWELWLPILPASTDRFDVFEVVSNGCYRAGLAQGLVRYAKWTVESGEASVKAVRLVNDGIHSDEPTTGSFECSDARLNALWKASARTCQLAAIPGRDRPISVSGVHTSAVLGVTYPYLSDGAKRDRLVWSGDLWWAQRNMYAAFPIESVYMPGSIRMLAENRTPEGYVQACPFPESHGPLKAGDYGPFASDEFAAWFVPVLVDHVLYTGDLKLAREMLPVVADLVGYLVRHSGRDMVFEQRIETCKHSCGLAVGGTSLHHRAYMNVLLWKTYRDAATLAGWLGEASRRDEWNALADRIAQSLRAKFWNQGTGGFRLSLEEPEKPGFEANALALASRFATEAEAEAILPLLKYHHHGKFQLLAIRGASEYGRGDKAMELLKAHDYLKILSPFWKGVRLTSECMHPITKHWGDEAHPDTAIAGVLTAGVLGVEPLEPGYGKYRFEPRPPKEVNWAKGRIPVPGGYLEAEWHRVNGRIEKRIRKVACP